MTDAETVAHLRAWKHPGFPFAWPTDACGYEQHIRYTTWRQGRQREGLASDWLIYADDLEAGKIPAYVEPSW